MSGRYDPSRSKASTDAKPCVSCGKPIYSLIRLKPVAERLCDGCQGQKAALAQVPSGKRRRRRKRGTRETPKQDAARRQLGLFGERFNTAPRASGGLPPVPPVTEAGSSGDLFREESSERSEGEGKSGLEADGVEGTPLRPSDRAKRGGQWGPRRSAAEPAERAVGKESNHNRSDS